MEIVLLFPGQGSQKPGMGKDLAETHAEARAVFEAIDAALGDPISTLCFEGPAETLTLTHNAQPALLAHAAAVWSVVREPLAGRVRAAAGHSLGEFSAHLAAGTFTLANAARLVRRRGELMLESGERRPGTMAAILGALTRPLEELCQQASSECGLVVPANYNSADQVVISGEVAGVERAMALAKDAGAKRAVRLNVSGAFHSPLMKSASVGLRVALDGTSLADPSVPVYANVNAEPVRTADEARTLLLTQLTSPVRWTSVIERLAADYPGALFVEMGPGNVLTTLVKRIVPGATAQSCGTSAEVDVLLRQAA